MKKKIMNIIKKCFDFLGLHYHSWSKWEPIVHGPVVNEKQEQVAHYIVLERICPTCGDRERKEIRT